MYQIISTNSLEETLYTSVLFTFPDDSQLTVDIAHFMPSSQEEIVRGIENRYVVEARRVMARTTNDTLAAGLPMTQQDPTVVDPGVPYAVSKLTLRRTLRSMGAEGLLDSFLAATPEHLADWNDAQVLMSSDQFLVAAVPAFAAAAGMTEDQVWGLLSTCREV